MPEHVDSDGAPAGTLLRARVSSTTLLCILTF